MKKLKLFFLFVASILITKAQNPTFQWAKRIGDVTSDAGNAITTDGSGNVYTTGYFQGTVDFDPGPGVFTITSVGPSDVFVSKLDALGNFVWAKTFGGPNGQSGNAIAIGNSGNVYVAGYFQLTSDFDPGPGVYTLTSAGSTDIFICKLSPSGNFIWAKAMGGANSDNCVSLTLDATENVYTTGNFQGNADFDPGPGVFTLFLVGGADIFVSKLDATGNFIWAKGMGSNSLDYGNGIALDVLGNILITGYYRATCDFDPSPGVYTITSVGGFDIFISKLDPLGNFIWAKSIGSTLDDEGYSIAADGSNNIYTTGVFLNSADFDPGPGVYNMISAGSSDIFISKLDASGAFVFAESIGGSSSDNGNGITLDANGNMYIIGSFLSSTVDFDPGPGVYNLNSVGDWDIFICKLDATGAFIWAKQMAGSDLDWGLSINVDAIGNVYSAGYFQGTADFDPGPGTYTLASAGTIDIFAAKLCIMPSQPGSIIGNTLVCSGNPFTFSTAIVPSASSYSWTFPGGWTGTSTTNIITATTSLIGGTISVRAVNNCGISSAQILSVTVNASPSLSVTGSGTICAGAQATLSANGANTYSWNTGPTNSSITVAPINTSTYSVTGTSTLTGCSTTLNSTVFVSTCIGLNKYNSINNKVIFRPNPNNGEFVIESNDWENATIEIIDLTGRTVVTEAFLQNKMSINLADLACGIYYLKVKVGDNHTEVLKMVKQ